MTALGWVYVNRQSAIVTGGAKRVGKALALGLAERGYDIGLHYNSSEKDANDTKKEIEKLGGVCHLLQADLLQAHAIADLIDTASKRLSNISLLINNASLYEQVDFLQTESSLLEKNLAIHVVAPFLLTQQFAKTCQSGNVINIVDTMINRCQGSHFAYLLSKKTLFDFTKMAARALAPTIRVNAIAPGSTLEPLDDLDSNYMERRARHIPLKLKGDPHYLLAGVDYLLSNAFVTGECLFIDGGAHIEF
jgi:pteridine reductase